MTTFRGMPCCSCLKEWLPVYEQMLLLRGVIKYNIDIYQLNGNAPASAGTHKGGAYDIAQLGKKAIRIARKMGAAGFPRYYNWNGKGGLPHQHGVLIGCPHNASARYQIDALKAGYNGLGKGGRGGRDTGNFRPKTWRNYQQGIAWVKKQIAKAKQNGVVVTNGQVVLDMKVSTANLCELPRHDQTVGADLKEIQALGSALVLFQEGSNDVYRKKIGKLSRLKQILVRKGPAFDVPLGYDPNVLTPAAGQSAIKVQNGWKGVTPNRWLASKQFRAKAHPDALIVARSVHPIAGAWAADGSKNRPGATVPRRQAEWRASRKKILKKVRKSAQKGLPQVLGTDANRKKIGLNLPVAINGYKVQRRQHGLDWLYFIDGKDFRWEFIGKKEITHTHSDHAVLSQRVRLVRR